MWLTKRILRVEHFIGEEIPEDDLTSYAPPRGVREGSRQEVLFLNQLLSNYRRRRWLSSSKYTTCLFNYYAEYCVRCQ